jgi:hypothetical protein
MSNYGFFKNCLEAVKTKYYSYKRPSSAFYKEVKEIRNKLWIAIQYDEITPEQYKELEKEFRRFCPD